MRRPRGARLLEAFSPKLSRRVSLFDHANFNLWISLEADPAVLRLCERPARLGTDDKSDTVDFWVEFADREEMLVLERSTLPKVLSERIQDVALRKVAAAEMSAASCWVTNWQRMLPVIVATHGLIPESLARAVVNAVQESVALARLEADLAVGDPSLVRAAIFDSLRTGRLSAPGLRTEALALSTLLEPAA